MSVFAAVAAGKITFHSCKFTLLTDSSGKSSLLSTIFRIMDIKSGSIVIDGIDISTIAINQYRGNINALAQDALFLPGTIRDNLISANSVDLSDERLERVLRRTGLWDKARDIGGLDALLDVEASLSHGERQLFCLARAMLNQSRILALDEFTSKLVLIQIPQRGR